MTRTTTLFAVASILTSTLLACSSDSPPPEDETENEGAGGSTKSTNKGGGGGKAGSSSNSSAAGAKSNGGNGGGGGGRTDSAGAAGTSKGGGGSTSTNKGGGGGGVAAGNKNTGGTAGGSSGNGGGKSGVGGKSGGESGGNNAGASGTGGTINQAGTSEPSGEPIERPNGCTANADLISDFEEGKGVVVKSGDRDGVWYVYADDQSGTQTPAKPSTEGDPTEAAQLPTGDQAECQKYAMHSSASNHTSYVGFGATLKTSGTDKSKVDLSGYDGVKLRLKSGSGTQNNIWFEFLTTADQPTEGGGTGNTEKVDKYNAHGQMLNGIGTTWTDVFVPFGTLAPRWLPDGGDSACASVVCETPAWSAKNVLGFQFSVYDAFTTAGSYDLWVDDVKLYKGDDGFGTVDGATGNLKYPQNKDFQGCSKPSKADGRAVIALYNKWKANFVDGSGSSRRVKSPDISSCSNAPCSVSEGIAYGMLIAAYMGDKKLFDDLWGYWKAHSPSGSTLMDWRIGAGGQAEGTGSASDADEDAAFALIVASKQWGDTYLTDPAGAKKMLADIWSKDIASNQVTGGSSYPSARNPSYLAPAYYRVFADYDTHDWASVASTSYTMLNAISSKVTSNLVPAWCTNGCTDITTEGHSDGDQYQYDSHRMPWRVGVDACWNGNADAKAYVSKLVTFFAGKVKTNGLGSLADRYTTRGEPASNSAHNSMSLIGCAGVGAMAAANQDFLDRAYQFVIDASLAPKKLDDVPSETSYTYYNATVGLLTALTMTGNFYPPSP